MDFVHDNKRQPKVVEISYEFSPEGYGRCSIYWDKELNWPDLLFATYKTILDEFNTKKTKSII